MSYDETSLLLLHELILISLSSPSCRFAELADLLEWDLYEDVYPMVRHLIYYREARVVDVPRINSTYSISPMLDLEE